MSPKPVYLDYAATTPCDPRVLAAMLPYFTDLFGNAASRTHLYGWQASEAVDYAREQVAKLINSEPRELVFTSGATEAINLAIKGVFDAYAFKGNHIITCVTEHKAVLDTCAHIEKMGAEVTYLPVNSQGLINIEELQAAIKPATILVAVMYANNETGVIQPIREISRVAKEQGIVFFSDATQAAGKIPVDVVNDGIDLLACSAHKLYGPKGVGALYVRRKNPRVKLSAQIDGGGHERGLRSGTLNVPGIVGFGMAAELCMQEMEQEARRLQSLRNRLESALLSAEATAVNGSTEQRLPHITNISFQYAEGEAMMTGFNKDIAVASGSACTSASLEPSHVLKALGLDDDVARSSLRFSVGRFTTEAEIDHAAEKVTAMVKKLRSENIQL